MKVIYKFGPMLIGQITEVEGFPVKVDMQDSEIFVWSVVNVGKYNRKLECRVIPTGYEFEDERFIGTVVTPHGLVWHVIGK